jgi:hypothetical protein
VAQRFGFSHGYGKLEALQDGAGGWAMKVAAVSKALGWIDLEVLLTCFQVWCWTCAAALQGTLCSGLLTVSLLCICC